MGSSVDRNSTVTAPQAAMVGPDEPFGEVVAPACRCGAGPSAKFAGRCARGHNLVGSPGPALVTGETSRSFWRERSNALAAAEAAVLADQGFAPADAPEALRYTAQALVRAALIAESAFERVAEHGGPLSASSRGRRAFQVWAQAVDRVERLSRLLGLRRVARPVDPLDAIRAAVAEANR